MTSGSNPPFVLKGKETEICQMYKAGLNTYEIAKNMGVTSKSIYNVLINQGIPRRNYRGYKLESVKKELIALYNQGIPVTTLAKKYGCSSSTITFLLKKEKVPVRPRSLALANRKPKVGRLMRQEAVIKKLYDQGLSYADIGKQVGTRLEHIGHFARARGWTRPRAIHKNSFIPQTNLILKLFTEEHLNALKIAEKIGCGQITVLKILKQNGIVCRDYVESNIKKLYDQGLSYEEIGKRLGRTRSGICRFVQSRGWTRPGREKNRKMYQTKASILENKALVLNLYTQKKLKITEIERQSGFSCYLIKKILTQEGVLNA